MRGNLAKLSGDRGEVARTNVRGLVAQQLINQLHYSPSICKKRGQEKAP